MLFNSQAFLYLFLPITYLVFWQLRTKTQRYVWLTLTGYVFYSFWNYKFCALMLFSTLVSYLAGLGFLRAERPSWRKGLLVAPLVCDLALLGYFKYANLLIGTTNAALGADVLPALDVVLPVGISFYTFHTITYVVDAYRGVISPTRNFFEFSAYVSLFAQLVAGPIVRFREIERDLDDIDAASRRDGLTPGWSLFIIGLAKKVLLADSIARIIDPQLARYEDLSSVGAWLCMLGYSFQLYFDFSGYSDMAVGLGRMFGLRLPQNFNSPYRALDISDFWRRWHISLSTFLRDYVFIPLGGSRHGPLRTTCTLMITMLLGGLWHGANWTFLVWGGYHGVLLCLNRWFAPSIAKVPAGVRRLVTFTAVVIGWTLFRSTDFAMAARLLQKMAGSDGAELFAGGYALIALLTLSAFVVTRLPNTFELSCQWSRVQTSGLAALMVASMFVIYGGGASPFLYFQF